MGWIIVLLFSYSCTSDTPSKAERGIRFIKISTDQSGLDFSNTITPNVHTSENLFDFDYFYNGAGVCVVDINNDHLPDILLTANQGDNRLFLNKGGLTFEDITETAGINVGKKWSNGVTTMDINGDGYMDFYISQGGPYVGPQRKNLLLINNGDLTFAERAEEYHLADQGISTQSAFFDYDKDGDLDCIVMNESIHYGHDPLSFHRLLLEKPEESYISYSHFYKNEGGTFVDVTEEAGLIKPTFGLGLAISDLNGDGYPDIYIANDYYLPDNLYINRQNGTFSDRIKSHLTQTAFFGMGVDVGDIDNDGHQDIYVLDMASKDHYRSKTLMASMDVPSFQLLTDQLGFVHQYMFNALHLNNGQGRYSNVAHLTGTAKTDWSWAALLQDVDLDGDKDIFVSNGYRKYALDNDFKAKVNAAKAKYNGRVPVEVKRDLYDQMPTEPLPNILFENDGQLQFENVAEELGLGDATYSNGAILADLDNDGDQDLIINNIDQPVLLYENNASEKNNFIKVTFEHPHQGLFAKVSCWVDGHQQVFENRIVRGYRSAVWEPVTIGLGGASQADSVIVHWGDQNVSKYENVVSGTTLTPILQTAVASTTMSKSKSSFSPIPASALGLDYVHQENEYNDFATEVLLPQKQSTLGPCMITGDVNGDDRDDLIMGGAAGQPTSLYVNNGVKFEKRKVNAFSQDADHEDVSMALFDLDGDGDQDLYIASGGNEEAQHSNYYQDRIYVNQGNGQFVKKLMPTLQEYMYSGGIVKALDYDQDGDDDILVGNRIYPQRFPVAAPSYLLENQNGNLVDVTESVFPELAEQEIVNDIEITDVNKDGQPDIIMVGEWSGIRVAINQQEAYSFADNTLNDLKGWWYSITPTDINRDGHQDYIIGNVGENIKHKASKETPFKVYANDFDETGTLDVVLASQYKGKPVPVRGKECSTQQMPYISEKFKTYDGFASASLVDIYGADDLDSSYVREATTFSSVLLIGDGRGGFEVEELPIGAQTFPMMDAVSMDVNDDGYEDLIAIGNIYNTEVETPRLDGGTGLVLLNDKTGGYVQGRCPEACMYAQGNAKRLAVIELQEKSYLLVLANDGALQVFSL